MGAYQQAANQPKTLETAQKVLQVNPCNIRALALLAFTKQAMATGPNAQQNLTDAGQTGEKGLQCLQTAAKPEGTPAADWEKFEAWAEAEMARVAGTGAFSAGAMTRAGERPLYRRGSRPCP